MKVSINIGDVKSAYNGKVGCMCGCLGDHAYASTYQAESGKRRGYAVLDEEVSDRKIKTRVKKIEDLIASGECDEVEITDTYIYVQSGERCFAAYFT